MPLDGGVWSRVSGTSIIFADRKPKRKGRDAAVRLREGRTRAGISPVYKESRRRHEEFRKRRSSVRWERAKFLIRLKS